MVKIMSGFAAGRSLKAPKGQTTRPTSARVREAIFSILRPLILQSSVLELFAGTGIIGLQAISEGASSVLAVEKDVKVCRLIKANAAEVLSGNPVATGHVHVVVKKDLLKIGAYADELILAQLKGANLIWADPPYRLVLSFLNLFLPVFLEHGRSDALMGLELASDDAAEAAELIDSFSGMNLCKNKKYGNTSLIFFSKI